MTIDNSIFAHQIKQDQASEDFYRLSGRRHVHATTAISVTYLLTLQSIVLLIAQLTGRDLSFAIVGATAGMAIACYQTLRKARRDFDRQDRRCDELRREMAVLNKFALGTAKPEKHVPN